MKVTKSYFSFFAKNYLRTHRYLREIVTVFIFHIFFWGFLFTERPQDDFWFVFAIFALILNIVTFVSVFYLEKGNSLYFTLVRPHGRYYYFVAKILLILAIDMIWIGLFALLYGLRFWDSTYFLLLAPRLIFMFVLIALSLSLLCFSYNYKPWIIFLYLILLVFGFILNKTAHSIPPLVKALLFILPPFNEIVFSMITMKFPLWRTVFLGIALLQIVIYLYVNYRLILRKDFV
ncbi:MAG: hypothetical protein Kow0042_11790 [Calditrichia bacterium]